jgi:hypothetical protein
MKPTDDYPQKCERAFVEIVADRLELRGIGKGEFSSQVWPWMNPKAARNRWAAIRGKAVNTGKPQNVTLADAQRMADFLHEDMGYLWALAQEAVKRAMPAPETKEKENERM